MDVWDVIILPILVVVGSFILASFLTPLGVYVIDTYGEKIIRRLFRWSIVMDKTKQCTSYEIGGVYIPQPIKNAINKLNLCKYFIKNTDEVAQLKQADVNPLPKDSIDIVKRPFLKFADKSCAKRSHIKRIIAKEKK